MRFNFLPLKFITLAISILLFSGSIKGQNYSFRSYNYEAGLPNDFIYTLNQTSNGYLWVGTGSGIVKFDGFSFFKVIYPDSLELRNPNASLKDKNGAIWYGCNDGTVFYTQDNNLIRLNIDNTKSISKIIEGPDSLVYIIPQGGFIFRVNPDNPEDIRKLSVPESYVLFSGAFNDDKALLLGSQGVMLFCENLPDTIIIKEVLESFDYSAVTSICPLPGNSKLLAGTESSGLYIVETQAGSHFSEKLEVQEDWEYMSVQSISTDLENRIWVSTYGSGVIQFNLDEANNVKYLHVYNSTSGLASDDVKLVFRDMEGNYWFGLFGKGLSMLSSYAFGYYTPGKNASENNILFIDQLKGKYILGTPSGFHLFDINIGKSEAFINLTSSVGGENILSYFLDKQGRIWIGTDGKGLYVRGTDGSVRSFYKSEDTGFNRINNIAVDDKYLWLATTNGIVVLDKQTGKGIATFSSSDGLPGKSINYLLPDNERTYIGTESDRLYVIESDLTIGDDDCKMTGSTLNKIYALARDKSGTIWAATYGNGVFACYGDSVVSFNKSNGLFSNYCYSIFQDTKNNFWIGHANALSKLNRQTQTIITYGADYLQGGTCNTGAIFESSDKKIFIGTNRGVIVYNLESENNKIIPPLNNINSIVINDVEYPYQPVISLKYGKYRVRIRYSGINFSNPDKVLYQPFLENYDLEPDNNTTEREVLYTLTDGKYKFHLLSAGENGIVSDKSPSFSIIIAKPFYKKWWFILLLIILVVLTIITIIRERDKAQKKIRDYLEEELRKRTELIVHQKNEIEIQNLEITDSINYAKRIQSSILPDVGKLKENFREAFVIFHPRDIVSGDFYWFDKIDENTFIIVCADSTGHGVPGALMSMIGSTLLQDIVARKKITRPSKILELLDKQIFSTLNQNIELGVANDGMDMVVCEVNLKTKQIRISSAMRPIIIVVGGESFYIKGSRSSVGGESVIDKYFDDQEYYLNEGDAIYLFSDGFPDQFGGVDGKKMKIARLKKVIEQYSKLPMCEQEKEILRFFEEWRGSYDQVDDILIMGIKM
ncbi:MAG TPA: two-component regulator propeller domain-containing protein [Bacteroidales bacterium]|nr:two-component regulator propeller domain-containing protein [Bacteroidales bacterium]